MDHPEPEHKGLSILQVIQSVLAATMGVQSNQNRERDFSRGSAKTFIVAGILGTLVLVGTVVMVVKVVLKSAGN